MRGVVAVASVMVLFVTGYAWLALDDLNNGLATSDVTTGAGPDGSLDILLVGKDSRTDAQGRPLPEETLRRLRAGANDASLTDTMILLHIPKDRSEAVAYSIPRDSYVSIPGGHGHHKINSAYGRGKNDAAQALHHDGVADPVEVQRRSSDAGRKLLVRTVQDLTGVGVDRYAEVNLLGFYKITQAVGGVGVCLKNPVDDDYSGAHFPAGKQTISGADALAFVRQRHGLPRGDLDRVVRQQAFLAGLARSMLSTGVLTNPAKLGRMFESVQQSIVLSDGWDILTFAQQMQGVAGGNIKFDTIPVEDPAYDTPDGQAVQVDPGTVAAAIKRGTKPPPPPAPPPPPTRPPDMGAVTVDVRNTTSNANLAARVLDTLDGDDVPTGDAANSAPEPESSIRYAPGNGDAARYVAAQLDNMPADRDSTLDSGDIRVLLADDYDGPGRRATPSETPTKKETAPSDPVTADGTPCIN